MFVFNCYYFLVAEVNMSNSTPKNKLTYLENGVNLKKNKISKLFLLK